MKILVTGAGGFLGSVVVERLLERGQRDIRCLVRSPKRLEQLSVTIARYPDAQVEVITGNLNRRKDAARAVEDVDVIFHLASAMSGGPADMFLNTVVGSRNLLDAVQGRRVRIVLVSSFGVYGVAELRRGALVDERTPLEKHPERRDIYSHTKLRQEQLFQEYQGRNGFELVILRPGVIYGPGMAGHFSSRVGLSLFGVFLHLGHGNRLPLSYVDNCAEAVVTAGLAKNAAGQVYNVHDDDLPTSRQYLRRYRREVKKIRFVPVPYFVLMAISRLVARYHRYSHGQLPAIFTPYKTASTWGGNCFDNRALKTTGWKQLVPTSEGLRRTFAAFRESAAR
jgi:nucleoside-diphosphate-sugar epimerase